MVKQGNAKVPAPALPLPISLLKPTSGTERGGQSQLPMAWHALVLLSPSSSLGSHPSWLFLSTVPQDEGPLLSSDKHGTIGEGEAYWQQPFFSRLAD